MSVGTMVGGRYELRARLGRGGFGTVWQARDATLERDVAVKLLSVEGEQRDAVVARFWREARAVASLNHPNVVTAHDFGVHDDSAYLVMEFIDGASLAAELATRRAAASPPLDVRRVIALGTQVSAGLGAAHEAGLVHRDLKPANIMMVRITGHAKIVDFGIARIEEMSRLTMTGDYLGTLPYASPEQMGPGDVDARSDLYSLGCVLYELLTGESPYQADSPAQWIAAHQYATPLPLRQRLPSVPAELEALVHELLAKDPAQRPPSADAVRVRLERIGGGVPLSAPTLMESTLIHTQLAPSSVPSPRPSPAPAGFRAQVSAPPVSPTAEPVSDGWQRPDRWQWPWAPPAVGQSSDRPLTSTVAGRLLMVFAVCCGFKALLAAAAVASVAHSVSRAFAGLPDGSGRNVVIYLMLVAIGWAASTAVIGVLAGANLRGSRPGRIWTWLLAVPYAIVCFAGVGTGDTLTSAASAHAGDLRPRVALALSEVRHAIPGWYVNGTTVFNVLALMAIIAAAVLLVSPATTEFVRARHERVRRYPR